MKHKLGVQALYNYQSIKYSHFEVDPGCSLVLTSDPWSYLSSVISKELKGGRRSTNKKCLEAASYFLKLAEEFYNASRITQLPTKGTLAYYSMLNLVKCYLSVQKIELENKIIHHGLNLVPNKKETIKVIRSSKSFMIFEQFAKSLDMPFQNDTAVDVRDLICHIPELHEIVQSLNMLPWARRKYLPVEILFLTNELKNNLFTEIRFEKRNEIRVETNKFYTGERKKYFIQINIDGNWIVYRSQTKKPMHKTNVNLIYKNILNDYKKFDIVSILTRNGYKYYVDLKPNNFHQLCNSFLLMFYIGSIARYKPFETQEMLTGNLRPIVSEAIETLPTQFLYQMVGLTSKSICVIPHSKIL
jgi:hypothetical protein